VVFELSPSGGGWTETVLYNFSDFPDASNPGGALVFDGAGNLYGTAPDGGQFAAGAVYRLSRTNGRWSETVIHDFTGGDDGAIGGLGPLLRDGFGNLYGVTEIGGAYSAGTVYRMRPGAGGTWQFTTLYAFQGQPDAAFPYGGLIADAHGNLYGTTYFGGANGAGAVFRVGPGVTFGPFRDSVLYSFSGGADGGYPTATLLFDAAGHLYGTTSADGDSGCDCGVVFKLTPTSSTWMESVLHTFGAAPDGANPYYGLTRDGAGNYFGTTAVGGTHNKGAVFMVTP